MSKLRQKNPTAIRTPEDDKGRETHEQDHVVHLEKSHVISPYIYNICREAHDKIYARDADLRILSRSLGKDYNTLRSSTTQYIPSKYSHCRDITDLSKPCCCQYEICCRKPTVCGTTNFYPRPLNNDNTESSPQLPEYHRQPLLLLLLLLQLIQVPVLPLSADVYPFHSGHSALLFQVGKSTQTPSLMFILHFFPPTDMEDIKHRD
ncbi:unnamed protein product [Acanthosepion pharaonis]|uniref:Out at first protein BRICHOS-like domain-containing protein n=1 Tax=Acanthosepion pharaonis TaxID=158019 RepID=A0A812CU82_ACAPH|nr:unnamed protein product [Sepia pharaonis]